MGEAPLEAGQFPGPHAAGKHLGLNPGGAPPAGPARPARPPRKSTARLLWLLFSLFVVYGTTFPFRFENGWSRFAQEAARINWRLLGGTADNLIVSDIVQNVLLFIPFGFLGYFSLVYKSSWARKAGVVLAGTALSASVEFLQIFSPVRSPALSDVNFNTLGAAAGLILAAAFKRAVLGFKSHPQARRFLDAPSAYPALIFSVLVAAGGLEPFDFSLDIGVVAGHVKHLIRDPIRFVQPDDGLIAYIRFLLASLFACRLLAEAGFRRPALLGASLMAAAGTVLELSQTILQSRSPEFQDAAVAVAGSAAGAAAFFFPGFHLRPRAWTLAGAAMIALSAAARAWYPFDFSAAHSGFNWAPFKPHFEHTTFKALGDFLESALIFFPLGFLLAYFHPQSRMAARGAALAAALALAAEWAQGFVPGRYADVTEAMGAALGGLAGALAWSRGRPAFREYMARDDDREI